LVGVAVGVAVGVGVSVGVAVYGDVAVTVGVAVCVGVGVVVGVSVGVAVGVGLGVFVGVGVGVIVGVSVGVLVGVGKRYVYVTQTVAPAWVATCVIRLPAPVAEKFAAVLTGIVTEPVPVKSLSGKYGDFTTVSDAAIVGGVMPDEPPKSMSKSNACKLYIWV
jgi:hypothetical protein